MLRKVVSHRKPSTNVTEYHRLSAIAAPSGPSGTSRFAAAEEQQRRKVEQVVDPHAPAAHESVHRSERAPRPRVDAALLRMPAGQLRDHRGERDEEDEAREDPQRDRRRAKPRAARDPSQADDRDDVHRDDVPEGEGLDQVERCFQGATVTTPILRSSLVRAISRSMKFLSLDQRGFPAAIHDLEVALPARTLAFAALPDRHHRLAVVAVRAAVHLERHRADWLAVGWLPVGLGEEERAVRAVVDDRAVERSAETPEHIVLELGRLPLDRIQAQRARRR